jgi:hypothetical protein
MRRSALLAVLALSLATLVAGTGVAVAQVPHRQTTLTGSQEAPGPGDGNGRGQFSWSLDGQRLCYLLSVKRVATAAAAHIHRGGRGVAGPVVVELEPPAPRASAECVSVASGLAQALRQNPGRYYVNVHNVPFPDGAVRGQLRR